MLENLSGRQLVLASNSPRRRELLASLGVPFQVRVIPGIDESWPPHLRGAEIAAHIAAAKAEAYRASLLPEEVVITADTIVCLDGQVFGKPSGRDEACAMLQALSGRTHEVITGVTLLTPELRRTFTVSTEVTFATLSADEIDYYVDRFAPYDKAGAYGIQEWIGYVAVTGIRGSYFNVMGLPVQRLYQELRRL